MPRKRRALHLSTMKERPIQRNAANARERARMRVLSRAFCRLKTTLPWVPPDTKLSKLDTLRLATSYIAHLRAVLNDTPDTTVQAAITNVTSEPPHPIAFTWPFSFTKNINGNRNDSNCIEIQNYQDDDDFDDDEDDDDWSSDVTNEPKSIITNDSQKCQNQNSFLSLHFSDTLMDIS